MPTVTIPSAVLDRIPPTLQLEIPEDDAGTTQTIAAMQERIDQGRRSAKVQGTAVRITSHVKSFDQLGQIRAICEWTRRNIRFRNDPVGSEALRTPDLTLEWKAGDCDDYATLIAALLESLGIRTRLVAAATNPRHPAAFTHVWPEALLKGRWLACDMARPGARLGQRPARVFRIQAYQDDGGQLAGLAGLGQGQTDPSNLVSATGTAIADIFAASHPQSSSTFYQATSSGLGPYGIGPGGLTAGAPGIAAGISGNTLWLLIGGGLLLFLLMRR